MLLVLPVPRRHRNCDTFRKVAHIPYFRTNPRQLRRFRVRKGVRKCFWFRSGPHFRSLRLKNSPEVGALGVDGRVGFLLSMATLKLFAFCSPRRLWHSGKFMSSRKI